MASMNGEKTVNQPIITVETLMRSEVLKSISSGMGESAEDMSSKQSEEEN